MKKLHTFKLDNEYSIIVYDNNSPSNYNRFVVLVHNSNKKSALHGTTTKTVDKSMYKVYGCELMQSWLKGKQIDSFAKELIENAFGRCFGLRDAIHSETLRKDALISLGHQTNLKISYLEKHINCILKF